MSIQVWGFLGPNGSGKTTTIRMICGLLERSAGSGTCLGYEIGRQSSLIKAETGYMTQKFSFWANLTIRENLEFVARLYRLPKLRQRVDETLTTLGLTDRQNQLAGAFRGMPLWAQTLGEILPLTHFLRIVRGVMLKGTGLAEIGSELLVLALFTIAISTIALLRYKRTLD